MYFFLISKTWKLLKSFLALWKVQNCLCSPSLDQNMKVKNLECLPSTHTVKHSVKRQSYLLQSPAKPSSSLHPNHSPDAKTNKLNHNSQLISAGKKIEKLRTIFDFGFLWKIKHILWKEELSICVWIKFLPEFFVVLICIICMTWTLTVVDSSPVIFL